METKEGIFRYEYETIAPILTLAFNALWIVWWLEFGKRFPLLGAVRLEFLLAGLLSIVAVVRSMSHPRSPTNLVVKSSNRDIWGWMLAFVVVQGISLPLAADFGIAWTAYVDRLAKYAVLAALIAAFVVSPKTMAYYLFSTFLAFLKVGQEAFFGKVTGNMVWESQGVPRLHGSEGSMFGHPNSLSGKFVATLPFVWYLWPTATKRWVLALLSLYVVFAINIVLFTASRTGYLTVIVVALVLVMFSEKKVKLVWVFAALAMAAVLFVPDDYKDRFLSAFTRQEKEGQSSETRKGLFYDSLDVFITHPLGVGLECFPVVQKMAGRNAQETHNLYTQILAEAGIQGAICFVGLLFVVLRKALHLRRRLSKSVADLAALEHRTPPALLDTLREERRAHQFLRAVANSVVVFIVCRLVLGVFGHDLMEIYWWLAAGLTMALHSVTAVAENRAWDFQRAVSKPSVARGTS